VRQLSAQEGRAEVTAASSVENLEGEEVEGSHRLHRQLGKAEVTMEFPGAVRKMEKAGGARLL
jgi:hypothetical protein